MCFSILGGKSESRNSYQKFIYNCDFNEKATIEVMLITYIVVLKGLSILNLFSELKAQNKINN